LIRTAMALALAGIFGLLTLPRQPLELRQKIARWAGGWLLTGMILLLPGSWFYYSRFPDFSRQYVAGLLPVTDRAVLLGACCAAFVLVVGLVFAVWKPRLLNRAVVALLLVAALGVMGSGEYLREFVRKPFVINGYIYANDMRVAAVAPLSAAGFTSQWLTAEPGDMHSRGENLFIAQCSSCHSIDGYRALRPRVRGWDAAFAAELVGRLQLTRGTMPPFAGNAADRAALGHFLAGLSIAPLSVSGENDLAGGRRVFEARCGMCHTVRGDLRPLDFTGSDVDSVDSLLTMLDSITPQMPPFIGTEQERRALANYLRSEE
jgi:cytochrome d ubiquinol oxidase subunit I